jgi:hypothetical protein
MLMAASLGMFGASLLYVAMHPSILDDIAASRREVGLPPERKRMKWIGLFGGVFFVLLALVEVVRILAN